MKQNLVHITFSIKLIHADYIEEFKETHGCPTRSAALAYILDDYDRLKRQENERLFGLKISE